jgi:hypothetical protein
MPNLATRCTAMLFDRLRFRSALTCVDRAAMRDRAALVRALGGK